MADYTNGKFEPNGLPGYSGVKLVLCIVFRNISNFRHFCGKLELFPEFITNFLSLGNSRTMSKRKQLFINIGIIVALVLAMAGLIMGTYFAYSIISQFEGTAGLGRL
jgi:hypothetical protein